MRTREKMKRTVTVFAFAAIAATNFNLMGTSPSQLLERSPASVQEVAESKVNIQLQKESLEQANATIEDKSRELSVLASRIDQLQTQYSQSRANQGTGYGDIGKGIAEQNKIQSQISKVVKDKKEIEAQMVKAKEQQSNAISSLVERAKEIKTENSELTTLVNDLDEQLNNADKALKKSQASEKELQNQLVNLKTAFEKFGGAKAKALIDLAKEREDLYKALSEMEAQAMKNEVDQTKLDQLEDQKKQLEKQLAEAKKELEQRDEDIAGLLLQSSPTEKTFKAEEVNSNLEKGILDLEALVASLKTEKDDLLKAQDSNEKTINDLEYQLCMQKDLTSDLEAKLELKVKDHQTVVDELNGKVLSLEEKIADIRELAEEEEEESEDKKDKKEKKEKKERVAQNNQFSVIEMMMAMRFFMPSGQQQAHVPPAMNNTHIIENPLSLSSRIEEMIMMDAITKRMEYINLQNLIDSNKLQMRDGRAPAYEIPSARQDYFGNYYDNLVNRNPHGGKPFFTF